MGLRQPGELLNRSVQQKINTPGYRANPGAAQIDTAFVDTLSRGEQQRQKQLEKQRQQKQKFLEALFENDADRYRLEAEAELANSQGVNALEQSKSIRQQYLNQLKERMQAIPEDYRQDPSMQMTFVKKAGQFDKFSIPYVNSEARKVEDDAFKARVANDMNTVVENATDLNYISSEGIPTVEKAVHERLIRTYGDDPNRKIGNTTAGELIMSEMQAAVSETIYRSIVQQVNVEDFDTASKTVEMFFDRITPDDRTKIMKVINSGLKDSQDDRALDLVNMAWQTQGEDDIARLERFITTNAGGDPDLRNKALSIAQSRHKIQKQAKEDRMDQIEAQIYNEVISGGQINQDLFMQLDPQRRNSLVTLLNKNNGGPAVVTDRNKYDQILQAWDNMSNEDIVKINVDERYRAWLSADDRNALRTKQDFLRRQMRGDWQQGQKWSDNVWKAVAKNFSEAQRFRGADAARINRLAMDEYARLMDENPRITRRELTLKLKKALWERAIVEKEDPSWVDRALGFFGIETEPDKIQSLGESLAPERPIALDPSWVRTVQEERIRKGKKPLNESELIRFFQFYQTRVPGANISAPRE